jgi:N-lysine methyltransferase SETD6
MCLQPQVIASLDEEMRMGKKPTGERPGAGHRTINDADAAEFVAWFARTHGAAFHEDIELRNLGPRGRGIVATADIPANTTLFRIPRSLILSKHTTSLITHLSRESSASNELGTGDGQWLDDTSEEKSWTSLILVLIREFLQGEKSPWYPYLRILPKNFDTPMFWSDEELAELRETAVYDKIGRAAADHLLRRKVVHFVQEHQDIFYEGIDRSLKALSEEELTALAHRMGSLVMAYAFDLNKDDEDESNCDELDEEHTSIGQGQSDDDEDGDEEESEVESMASGGSSENSNSWVEDTGSQSLLGMVPMADMLNADADFNAYISHGQDALTAVSVRRIKTGQEVLNHYGSLSNGELLRRYGYVTETHSVYDIAELPGKLFLTYLRNILQIDHGTWSLILVDLSTIDDELLSKVFIVHWSAPPPDEEGHVSLRTFRDTLYGQEMAVASFSEELKKYFRDVLAVIGKLAVDPSWSSHILKAENGESMLYLRCLWATVLELLARYPIDDRVVQEGKSTPSSSQRVLCARKVRAGEQQLLRSVLNWTESCLSRTQA